jgi:hypothetical protein
LTHRNARVKLFGGGFDAVFQASRFRLPPNAAGSEAKCQQCKMVPAMTAAEPQSDSITGSITQSLQSFWAWP